jgi:hypothetical protein
VSNQSSRIATFIATNTCISDEAANAAQQAGLVPAHVTSRVDAIVLLLDVRSTSAAQTTPLPALGAAGAAAKRALLPSRAKVMPSGIELPSVGGSRLPTSRLYTGCTGRAPRRLSWSSTAAIRSAAGPAGARRGKADAAALISGAERDAM